jgi:hypothetical protein
LPASFNLTKLAGSRALLQNEERGDGISKTKALAAKIHGNGTVGQVLK